MTLDQLMALPPRESKRATKTVLPWVKIKESTNPFKPKVQLSSKSIELIASPNEYILFRENNGELYIVSPSPFSLDGEPNKQYDTRIGVTGRLEITKACIETWQTDLRDFHGEYLIEFVGEAEVGTKEGTNTLIKTFKLVANGNSEQSAEQLSSENPSDGVSHNESESNGDQSGLSGIEHPAGGDHGQNELLSEDLF
jgi:hypothetical protein